MCPTVPQKDPQDGLGFHFSAVVVSTDQDVDQEEWLRNERTVTEAVGGVLRRPVSLEVTGPGVMAVVCDWDGARWATQDAARLAMKALEAIKAEARGRLLLTVSIEAYGPHAAGGLNLPGARRPVREDPSRRVFMSPQPEGEVVLSERWESRAPQADRRRSADGPRPDGGV